MWSLRASWVHMPTADEKPGKKKDRSQKTKDKKLLHNTSKRSPSHNPTRTLFPIGSDSLFWLLLTSSSYGRDTTGLAVQRWTFVHTHTHTHTRTVLPHEVSICCTWQAAGSAQFARLVKSDSDKTRPGVNWHTEERKSTATANIWWWDFRGIGDGSWCWHLCNICTVRSSESVSLPKLCVSPLSASPLSLPAHVYSCSAFKHIYFIAVNCNKDKTNHLCEYFKSQLAFHLYRLSAADCLYKAFPSLHSTARWPEAYVTYYRAVVVTVTYLYTLRWKCIKRTSNSHGALLHKQADV